MLDVLLVSLTLLAYCSLAKFGRTMMSVNNELVDLILATQLRKTPNMFVTNHSEETWLHDTITKSIPCNGMSITDVLNSHMTTIGMFY